MPQTAISENSLAERIGVSRTPIREALQRLEADGLVRVFRQRSSYVAPLDDQAIRSAYFVRLSL
ncbi:MAG TPA: GntR family transcriptional regulator, partial [Methanomassiliicoccales archaeon]|nr:GntR family transcriptional regulator [Methanomassiliicoccales archaeon]